MGDEGDAIIQSYSISLMAKTATIFALFLARSKNLGQEHVSPSHYITFPSKVFFMLSLAVICSLWISHDPDELFKSMPPRWPLISLLCKLSHTMALLSPLTPNP